MIKEFARRRAQAFAEWQPTQGGPLLDAGALLLRMSQQRGSEKDLTRSRVRELGGRGLLAMGSYLFIRALFDAAEQYGYARGTRGADAAFASGRHAGMTEAAVTWGLPMPGGLMPYNSDQAPESALVSLWPLRYDEQGHPVSPYRDHVDQAHEQPPADEHAQQWHANVAAMQQEETAHGPYVVIGARRFHAAAPAPLPQILAPAGRRRRS